MATDPECTIFASAEGFGEALNGPARERVLAKAIRDRNFMANTNPIPVGRIPSGGGSDNAWRYRPAVTKP